MSITQKTDTKSSEYTEKKRTGKKMPLVSCDKYNEEERKSLFGEEKTSESFSGSIDE